jgi:hypothetical protein
MFVCARRPAPLRRTGTLSILLLLAALALPAAAQAAGTITVSAAGLRSASNTDSAYAQPLAGVGFQVAPRVSNPAIATWSALCVTLADGACQSAVLPNGQYLVREAPAGAPAGAWVTLPGLAWGGTSSVTSPPRDYVGEVTVSNNNATVHPSTAWSPTAPSAASGSFMTTRTNPPLAGHCGLDVLLLLDRSGSITDDRITYRDSALALVATLTGTATRLKIFSFAESAAANQPTFLDLRVPADVATANAVIAAVYSTTAGATNWDAAMSLAASAGVDAVVFVTDGNPTFRNSTSPGANSDGGNTVDLLDLTSGVASANLVKTLGKSATTGATILGVGVGDGITPSNLATVTGPNINTDYYISTVATLNARLQTIAGQLCPQPPPAPAPPPVPPPPATTQGSAPVTTPPAPGARLSGPGRCVAGPFTARVTGRNIARVRFTLNGKTIKTITAGGFRTVFKVRVVPRRGARRVLRVLAHVTYKPSYEVQARTLRLVFVGCPRRAVSPRFVG